MTRHRRSAFVLAPFLVVALLAGSACSSNKKDSVKPFCTAMGDAPQLFSLLTVKGAVDPVAFKEGVSKIEKLAPAEVHSQVVYMGQAYDGYFKVASKKMTVAEFDKKFPKATIQAKRAEVDGWMREHCGFGIDG